MPPSYTIPVLKKSFAVIKCLSDHNDGLSLAEIVKRIGAPKSTVFKILFTLEEEKIVLKKGDRYFLGSMLIHYGLNSLSQRDLRTAAQPFLINLMEKTGETAHLTVPIGMESMILDVIQTAHPIRFSSPVGNLFPLYCTSHGKALLAHTSEFSLEEYLRQVKLEGRTKFTITSPENLKKELSHIRERGYSMDEIEYADDIRCCASPVRDSSGKIIAAVGITSTVMTFGPERIPEISRAVRDTARLISEEMGFRD